ncbi:Extracellular solute-binding protein, family 3 [Artemisia annua]|uniref:Extracellular solute-binding protein, family 3 n=1 Tax=Artemisia annua TaxID=35608 RepID=A0A2U1KCU1_ARTAN|nr:Extracellular solute-binding protein, family 3 [Artemisia annua]
MAGIFERERPEIFERAYDTFSQKIDLDFGFSQNNHDAHLLCSIDRLGRLTDYVMTQPYPSSIFVNPAAKKSSYIPFPGRIRNKFSKVVLVMWLSMLFMVLQIFNATLSSWLTLDLLRPPWSAVETVGYQEGSFIKDLINKRYNFSGKNVKPLHSAEEYKNALSNGSVDVILDELPYIELFLSRYGSEYIKYGPVKQEPGFAFAFPIESPILQPFSRAVLNNLIMPNRKVSMFTVSLGYSYSWEL